jgi:clathrin heavy chain
MPSSAATFVEVQLDDKDEPSTLFCCTRSTSQGPRLTMIELGVENKEDTFKLVQAMDLDAGDMCVNMVADPKRGVLFVITRQGKLLVFEIQSGKQLFNHKAASKAIFTACPHEGKDGGIIAVDRTGKVSHFFIDEKSCVPYVTTVMNDLDLAVSMARRYNLPGAENIFKKLFQKYMQTGRHDDAMQLAADSPKGSLRTAETIHALRTGTPNGSGLLTYFQLLLGKGKLNAIESVELAKPILKKGSAKGIQQLKQWLKDEQLEPSEQLGNLLKGSNVTLALSVYLHANVPEKVIGCFLQLGAQESDEDKAKKLFMKAIEYAAESKFEPDYAHLTAQLARANREKAKDFALMLIAHEDGDKLDINQALSTFMGLHDVKSSTSLLLAYLAPRGDRDEDADRQTRLFEMNLLTDPRRAPER